MKPDAVGIAEKLARDFLGRVWGPKHELDVIDELMTPDYVIHSGGKEIRGRDAFKAWVAEFFRNMPDATDEIVDVFANPSGDRVVARWICTGKNGGVFGLPADGKPISFHEISVWKVRDGRLAECWVEREPPRT
ncbi:MAG: nuclear transport factor 2 family protein [Steroidobacteraceae bacterium]